MSAPLLAAVGHGSTALWYMTRATGLVALVLLTGTVALGIVCSVGWASERWPRFVSQSLHRNLSLMGLALIVVHVITTVADGYVPIGLVDALIPFRSPYRPLWVGLGACAFDLLLAVAITSGLRRRIGVRVWRTVHWLAYVCWPIALSHGLGSGTDTRLPGAQFVYLLCVVTVVAALGWRLLQARSITRTWRLGAAVGTAVVLLAVVVFAFLGPLRPGWSRRSGTSSALLAQLSGVSGASRASPASASSPAAAPTGPFASALQGSYSVAGPDASGRERVVISTHLQSGGAALIVALDGQAAGSGVEMTASQVTLGTLRGFVTSLNGSSIEATVGSSAAPEHLSIQLQIDQVSHAVSGSVSGTPAAPSQGNGE